MRQIRDALRLTRDNDLSLRKTAVSLGISRDAVKDYLTRFEAAGLSWHYPTLDALRQAISRNTVPVKVFTIPNRRSRHALTRDVALWLATQRLSSRGEATEDAAATNKKGTPMPP